MTDQNFQLATVANVLFQRILQRNRIQHNSTSELENFTISWCLWYRQVACVWWAGDLMKLMINLPTLPSSMDTLSIYFILRHIIIYNLTVEWEANLGLNSDKSRAVGSDDPSVNMLTCCCQLVPAIMHLVNYCTNYVTWSKL